MTSGIGSLWDCAGDTPLLCDHGSRCASRGLDRASLGSKGLEPRPLP